MFSSYRKTPESFVNVEDLSQSFYDLKIFYEQSFLELRCNKENKIISTSCTINLWGKTVDVLLA